jgi:hypothetical protein
MSASCQQLHDWLSCLPRLKREDLGGVPPNGVYVLFEKGENGHGGKRIVRVGTHSGQNNLGPRIREHLYTSNKDRSIFRKHVGYCLLARAGDVFLDQWKIDLTTKRSRQVNADKIDRTKLAQIENDVTQYMCTNFSFTVLRIDEASERLRVECGLLSTLFQCHDCGPSTNWLGKFHPTRAIIRESGLWNVLGLNNSGLSEEQIRKIMKVGAVA